MKKPGWSIILIAGVVLIVAVRVEAQQPGKVFRIGFLDSSTASGMCRAFGDVPARADQAWLD